MADNSNTCKSFLPARQCCSVMDNGDSPISQDFSITGSLMLPTVTDQLLPIGCDPSLCHTEVNHQFGAEIVKRISPSSATKVVEELSQYMCKYHFLAIALGSTSDGEQLRRELAKLRQRACDIISSTRLHLVDAFKSVESLSKKEVSELERTCRVLVGCIHTLDRELRRTRHLFHLFPLTPDPDGLKECHFIRTGLRENMEIKSTNAIVLHDIPPSEKFIKERESWQDLEKEILDVHSLDLALHRDAILGPVMDYLTLCPIKGFDDISSSAVSVEDACVPSDVCVEDAAASRKSNIVCYAAAIMTVIFIGGGVLMGVIFIIVE